VLNVIVIAKGHTYQQAPLYLSSIRLIACNRKDRLYRWTPQPDRFLYPFNIQIAGKMEQGISYPALVGIVGMVNELHDQETILPRIRRASATAV